MATSLAYKPCPVCNGTRLIVSPNQQLYQTCPLCGGTGYWVPPGLFFIYGIDFALTANQTNVQGNILVQDHNFRWMFATAKSTGTFTFTIQDTAYGSRQFQSQIQAANNQPSPGVQNTNFWGNGTNVFALPVPYDFIIRSQIKIVVNDTSGGVNNVSLNFIGFEFDSSQAAVSGQAPAKTS